MLAPYTVKQKMDRHAAQNCQPTSVRESNVVSRVGPDITLVAVVPYHWGHSKNHALQDMSTDVENPHRNTAAGKKKSENQNRVFSLWSGARMLWQSQGRRKGDPKHKCCGNHSIVRASPPPKITASYGMVPHHEIIASLPQYLGMYFGAV